MLCSCCIHVAVPGVVCDVSALRARKGLGGAWRKPGPLAAAALVAMEDAVERFQKDHDHAKTFAKGCAYCMYVTYMNFCVPKLLLFMLFILPKSTQLLAFQTSRPFKVILSRHLQPIFLHSPPPPTPMRHFCFIPAQNSHTSPTPNLQYQKTLLIHYTRIKSLPNKSTQLNQDSTLLYSHFLFCVVHCVSKNGTLFILTITSQMLIDFNDVWWEYTRLYLQQTGIYLSLYGVTYA